MKAGYEWADPPPPPPLPVCLSEVPLPPVEEERAMLAAATADDERENPSALRCLDWHQGREDRRPERE